MKQIKNWVEYNKLLDLYNKWFNPESEHYLVTWEGDLSTLLYHIFPELEDDTLDDMLEYCSNSIEELLNDWINENK